MIVAVTGHRPQKLGCGYGASTVQDRVREELRGFLRNSSPDSFEGISGMALGVDQWFAEICIELGIPFTAAIPFDGQENKWPLEAQTHYHEILARAAVRHIVCPGGYAPWKMQRRNEYMVDNCDVLLAVWDGSPGGTANCVKYAEQVGKYVWRLDPKKMETA